MGGAYRSHWRLFRGRPHIETPGRYVRVPTGTPFYPGYTLLGSGKWTEGEKQLETELGEVRDNVREWSNGQPPNPFPLAIKIGNDTCVESGESQTPLPTLGLLETELNGDGDIVGTIPPDVTFNWNPTPQVGCVGVLIDDDTGVLMDDDTGVLIGCDCVGVLIDDDTGVLMDDDTGVEISCDLI